MVKHDAIRFQLGCTNYILFCHVTSEGLFAPEHDEGLADVVSALLEETRPKVTAAA